MGHKSRNGIGVDGILVKIVRNQETAASVGGGLPEHVKIARPPFFFSACCLPVCLAIFFFFFLLAPPGSTAVGGTLGGTFQVEKSTVGKVLAAKVRRLLGHVWQPPVKIEWKTKREGEFDKSIL